MGDSLHTSIVSQRVGDASALKVCYAGLTKGFTALATQTLVAAHRLGVGEALEAELSETQATLWEWMDSWVGKLPPRAHRWVSEMEEIGATHRRAGQSPWFHNGAADIYGRVARTALGQMTPEEYGHERTLRDVIAAFVRELEDTDG